jgi:hypothetical protein
MCPIDAPDCLSWLFNLDACPAQTEMIQWTPGSLSDNISSQMTADGTMQNGTAICQFFVFAGRCRPSRVIARGLPHAKA